VAFHYSVYRSLIPFLGLDGNPFPEHDATGLSLASIWNQMLLYVLFAWHWLNRRSNDFINPTNGTFDPKHLYGASNFDVFRWPALTQGRERQMLATFITAIMMPGVPLYYYGEEQGMYLFDNDADDFLYG
jgi:alpha-1,3-glucan synthase